MSSQAYVDDAYVEPAGGELSTRVVDIANECNNLGAKRSKGRLQVVGQKPFVLNNQDPTYGWGCSRPRHFAISTFETPVSLYRMASTLAHLHTVLNLMMSPGALLRPPAMSASR